MGSGRKIEIDLNEVPNHGCIGGCNKKDREFMTDDDLCLGATSALDGKKVRCVGSWSYNKIVRLVKYYGIFTGGMKKKWPLNYIEICSGPGRCIYRDKLIEVDGTALAILKHKNFDLVRQALFIDNNPEVVSILNERIKTLDKSEKARAEIGDYTDEQRMKSLLDSLSYRGLNLVLVDPTDCSLPFSTIKLIKETLGKADLLINVPLYTDAGRNLRRAILNPDKSEKTLLKYSSFLGDYDFLHSQEIIQLAEFIINKNSIFNNYQLRKLFIQRYIEKLGDIGYAHCDKSVEVADQGRRLYLLLFASANQQGLDFWKKTLDHVIKDQLDLGI